MKKIKDKYIDEAFHLQLTNMLKLDADRLLAGFRETAGLIAGMSEPQITEFMKNKQRYGGMWEDGLIGGHTLGHYLTALAQAKVNPALTAADIGMAIGAGSSLQISLCAYLPIFR